MPELLGEYGFSGSAAAVVQFNQPFANFANKMEERRELWSKLTPEQRAVFEAADPVMQKARSVYNDLKEWFG